MSRYGHARFRVRPGRCRQGSVPRRPRVCARRWSRRCRPTTFLWSPSLGRCDPASQAPGDAQPRPGPGSPGHGGFLLYLTDGSARRRTGAGRGGGAEAAGGAVGPAGGRGRRRTEVPAQLLRAEFDAAPARSAMLHKAGKVSPEAHERFGIPSTRIRMRIAVLREKQTLKNRAHSGIPPSPTDGPDETARGAGKRRTRSAAGDPADRNGFPTLVLKEPSREQTCATGGADLEGVAPWGRGCRTLHDLEFRLVERTIKAEIQPCPVGRKQTGGRFPDRMPGPIRYGRGLQAFVLPLLVAPVRSRTRAAARVRAMTGRTISGATCRDGIRRLGKNLQPWKEHALERRRAAPARPADGNRLPGRGQEPLDSWARRRPADPARPAPHARDRGLGRHRHPPVLHRRADPCPPAVLLHLYPVPPCALRRPLAEGTGVRRGVGRLPRGTADEEAAPTDRPPDPRPRCQGAPGRGRPHGPHLLPPPPHPGRPGTAGPPEAPEPETRTHRQVRRTPLHERRKQYETEVLRFALDPYPSFTHHPGEQDPRRSHGTMKVSGGFRTLGYADRYGLVSRFLPFSAALVPRPDRSRPGPQRKGDGPVP